MVRQANKHRRSEDFQVGQSVYLKLQPYKQVSLRKEGYTKLGRKYYGSLSTSHNPRFILLFMFPCLNHAMASHQFRLPLFPPWFIMANPWFLDSPL
ncbi:hypothetical protein Pint_00648 [Pistacia integerrima]|uniref:Uncharacterized protein n=1 Tax=Pistacia integerrima TaxID=434235 RepID=A0ACC0ZM55_9ROSI|nr:hypothetical protein Pint_00648 [Pistacia integerrima]